MNNEHAPEHMRENVLTRIREGSVHMHSRKYFYLGVAVTLVVALFVLLLSGLIFNFILFSIFTGHRDPLLGYGPSGYLVFLQLFPWTLLIADILFLLLLRYLLRRFEFAYRSPMLYVFAILLILMAAFGYVLYHHTDVNERIEHEAHAGHLPPPVGSFFDDVHRPPPAVREHH